MATEDFTTYDKQDPPSPASFTITASKITVASLDWNDTGWVADFKGTDHFGNFDYHKVDVMVTGHSGSGAAGVFLWALADLEDEWEDLSDAIGILLRWTKSASEYRIALLDKNSGNSTNHAISVNTWYYLRVIRSGSLMTVRVYGSASDRDNGTNELSWSPLTITASTTAFDYVFGAMAKHNATGIVEINAKVQNLDLQEGVIVKEVTDALSLSDAVLCNKNLVVTDSVELADTPLKDWTPEVADSVVLSDVIYRHKPLVEIADALSISDVVFLDKTLLLTDSVNLSDFTLIDKTLAVTDSISLSELVTVIGAPVIKEVLDAISLSDQVRAACFIEPPALIVTRDGKLVLRISRSTKSKPDYILLGG